MDYDDTHVLDFEPNLKTLCIMSVIENNLDQTWLPQEIRYMMLHILAAINFNHIRLLLFVFQI